MVFRLACVVLAVWALGGGADRPAGFPVVGPGGGGVMFHPSVSPMISTLSL